MRSRRPRKPLQRNSDRARRWAMLVAMGVGWTTTAAPAAEVVSPTSAGMEEALAAALGPDLQTKLTTPASSTTLKLLLGQVESIPTEDLKRVAVGDPAIADVIVLSDHDLLLRAENRGSTTLIVWDAAGQRQWTVVVEGENKIPGVLASLRRMLDTEGFVRLLLNTEGDQVYVSGRLNTEQEKERLEKLLETFPSVANLTVVALATEQTVPLVELEVQLIEVSKSAVQQLGIDWNNSTTITETPFGAAELTEAVAHRLSDIVRVGTLARNSDGGASMGFKATINHMLDEGKARLLAATNQVTLSGKSATTLLGGEIPVITSNSVSSGGATQNIEFKPIGTILTITPTVSLDLKKINALVEAEVRAVDLSNAITISGQTVPGFRVRKTKTEMMSKPDETIIIAGLLQNEESQSDAKVPKLANVPLFGRLFRNSNYRVAQTELLVAVTPHLPRGHSATKLAGLHGLAMPVRPTPVPRPVPAVAAPATEPLSGMDLVAPVALPPPAPATVTAYARDVQERVANGLALPRAATTGSGAVRLRLHVLADGTLDDVRVVQSSGDRSLDETATAAAVSQGPYPAFPTSLTSSDLWLEFPVIFNPS